MQNSDNSAATIKFEKKDVLVEYKNNTCVAGCLLLISGRSYTIKHILDMVLTMLINKVITQMNKARGEIMMYDGIKDKFRTNIIYIAWHELALYKAIFMDIANDIRANDQSSHIPALLTIAGFTIDGDKIPSWSLNDRVALLFDHKTV